MEHVAAARDGGLVSKKTVFKPPECRSKCDEVREEIEGCSWFFICGGPKATSFRTYPGDPSACVAKQDVQVFVRGQQETLGTPRQKRRFVSAQSPDPLVLEWRHSRSPAVERSGPPHRLGFTAMAGGSTSKSRSLSSLGTLCRVQASSASRGS